MIGTQSGHHLDGNLGIRQAAELLGQGAVQARIAVMEAHHPPASPGPLHHHLHHLLQGEGAGANRFTALRSHGGDLGRDQGIGPDEHLRPLDRPGGPQGQQIRGPRPRPHDQDLASAGLAGWSIRRCGASVCNIH